MTSMTSADLPTIFDPKACVRKGLCPVTILRGQQSPFESHSLYFEQHGTGQDKIVFIIGMNATMFGWAAQVEHFAKSHSVLVFDNRGVGNSGTPRGAYSTSGMAEDAIVLLDYIGWTGHRELHIVGISMGGMISQELALKIPHRIASLSLLATKAGVRFTVMNLTPWSGMFTLIRFPFVTDDEARAKLITHVLYPEEWLNSKAPNDEKGRTHREVSEESFLRRIRVTRKQPPRGAISQMWAALAHHVSPERLRTISEVIPSVLIVTGDKDNLIRPVNSRYLHDHLPGSQYEVFKGFGHGLLGQDPPRFNALLEAFITSTKTKLTIS